MIAKETAKQTATQVTKGAYVLKEAYKGAVSAASWQYATENFNWGSLERFKGSLNYLVSRLAVQTLAGGQGGIVDNVANEEFWDEFLVECGRVGIEVGVKVMLEAALNKEIDEGIISALGQGLSKAILEKRNEQFKDSDKDMTKEELEGELKSVGNEKAALEVEWKELSAKDVSEMTSIEKKEWKSKRNELIKKLKQKTERLDALSTQIEIRISHQMQADSQGRLAYRRGESLNGIKRNITEEVAKRKDLDEGQKERLEKELKGALEEGYDLERLEAAGEGKDKWPLLEELSEQEKTAIKRGELRKDAEGFVRAGFNSNVQELKVRKELGAEADKEGLEGRDKERFVREGVRYYKQVKKKGLLSHQEAASEAGQAREKYLQARGDAYEAMTKMNRAKQEIATMGRGKAFALGVLTGAISAGLEKVSSKFGSPFDGAIINAGLTSIFYSAMVPDKYIFEQEIPLGDLQDEQSFEPAIERIQHSKGFLSKFRFYSNKITDTFTQANAQALSGGKADAVIYTDSETGLTRYGFKWRPSDSGSAVRDAQRWQTIAEEGVMAAMYDGYISSLHYQSVNNLRDVAKGWHNKPYVMTAKPPTWTQRQYLLNQAVEAGAGDIIRRSAIQDIGNIITGNATILINAVGFDALVEEAKEILGFDVNDKLAEAKTLALLTGVGVGVDQAKKLGLSLPSIGGDPLLYLTQKADDLEKGKVDQSEFKQGKVFINEQGDKLKITRVEDDKEKKGEKRICYAKYAKGNDIRPVESGFDLSLEEFAVKAGGETKDGSLYLSSDEQRKETAKALREYIDMRQQARYGVRWEILAFSLPVDYAKKSSYVQNDIIPKIREAKVRQEVNKELAKEIGKIEQGVKNEFGYEEKKEAMLKGRWKKLLTEGKVGVDVIEAGKLYKEWSELKKEYKKELVESIKERRTEIEEGTENTEGVRDKWEERMPARTDRWKPSVG
ncbi:MAG: hypothetical protein KKD55_00625, partial [Candidatus Omnitrophica bacterium]|nr:hypothetical protein [Candidatus Omnitrophota bacterium]